jgi:uncharacterized protein
MPEGSTKLIKPEHLKAAARFRFKENKRFLIRMKSFNPKELDHIVHHLHDQVFSYTDCLACANCCKTISPAMRDRDVERLASALRIKPSEVVSKYMHLDTEGDYVFNSSPCPLLDIDNRCKVYDHRPKACREYPHTNRRKFNQLLDLTLKNTEICPAVFAIVGIMKGTTG